LGRKTKEKKKMSSS